MKTPYLTYRFGCTSIPDDLNFLLIHLDTLCSYNIAKKHNFLHAKGTLFKISIQFLTTQHTKYITQMIKDFSVISKPLSNLLTKDNIFEWTEHCEEVFVKLKNLLTSAPVIQPPNLSLPFEIMCDASDSRGCCLGTKKR